MVALGFSPYAKEIFNYAAGLAQRLEADLTMVNVFNTRDVTAVTTISDTGSEME